MIDPNTLARIVGESPVLALDVETDGLDWRFDKSVGYVVNWGPAPHDACYLPFGHASNNGFDPRPIFRKVLAPRRDVRLVFFNAAFDLKFFHVDGVDFCGDLEDGQINASLIDERQTDMSLDGCCKFMGVQTKKGEALYQHMAKIFGGEPTRKAQMKNFHLLLGNDPLAHEYATGDGISTWALWSKQQGILDEQDLRRIWGIECRTIRVLHRMTVRGIRVDEERLAQVRRMVAAKLTDARRSLPEGFNDRAPSQVLKLFTDAGIKGWPMTAPSKKYPNGQPSFKEEWLNTTPIGKKIVAVRKLQHLTDSFLVPMVERHLWKGRVHTNFNQVFGEEFGTHTGRLSSNNPNLQQIHKRNKELGSIFRSIFVPDKGMIWASCDYSQCFAAGTQVMVPGGTKNIEDVEVGDWVYSYDNRRQLTLKKVTWSGQTGVRPLCRLKWITNGRTSGYLDVTQDQKIQLIDGTYKTPTELAAMSPGKSRGRKQPHFIRVMALRRDVARVGAKEQQYYRNKLCITGRDFVPEARFIFEQIHGWSPEVVHHIDENSLNDDPSNLEGLTRTEHLKYHGTYGMKKLTAAERKERSMRATRKLQERFKNLRVVKNNHIITHIIPLPGEHPVYDITVEDTHNFIANEICVHNCEPRLLAHYADVKTLKDGYLQTPFVDAHSSVAKSAGIDREAGKRINQGLVTGAGMGRLTELLSEYGADPHEAARIMANYFAAMPEIKPFQKRAANVMLSRGYIRSLLGRRSRLERPDLAYKAVNRILQCGNADLNKLALCDVDEWYESQGDVCNLINDVHDDLCQQFHEEDRPIFKRALELMEDCGPGRKVELSVPMVVDAGEGSNWAEATYGKDKVVSVFKEWGEKY